MVKVSEVLEATQCEDEGHATKLMCWVAEYMEDAVWLCDVAGPLC